MSLTIGEKVCAFIEKHCKVPEGDLVGQNIKLADFQRKFIIDVYDNPYITDTAILSMARKNAKTAIISCLVIVHVVGPVAMLNSRIVSCGQSREQASEVFNYAVKIIEQSPLLTKLTKVVASRNTIIGKLMNTEYKAIASDAKRAHGKSPLVLILDEVGQIRGPNDEFVDAMTTSQGAYTNPLCIYISTQAANDGDYFSLIIDDAIENKPKKTVCHVYAAPKDCDLMDEEAWKAANPALGLFRSETTLRKVMEDAVRMPSQENKARNLMLNQRVERFSPFVSRGVWESCANAEIGKIPQNYELYGGLDLSARKDLTAFVLIGVPERRSDAARFSRLPVDEIESLCCDVIEGADGEQVYLFDDGSKLFKHKGSSVLGVVDDNKLIVEPYFWSPDKTLSDRAKEDKQPYDLWASKGFLRTTPGATVDYEYVVKDILDIVEGRNLQVVGFDRWRIDVFKKELARLADLPEFDRYNLELPLEPVGQGFKDMTVALDSLEADLLNAKLAHPSHPLLNMCAANAVQSEDPAGGRKLDKHKASGRIDGLVALAIAEFVLNSAKVEEKDPHSPWEDPNFSLTG